MAAESRVKSIISWLSTKANQRRRRLIVLQPAPLYPHSPISPESPPFRFYLELRLTSQGAKGNSGRW